MSGAFGYHRAMIESPDPILLELRDPEETRALGRTLARVLRAGTLLRLSGSLGAGKTTLAQGIAAGLGVDGVVASPSYTLVREHELPAEAGWNPARRPSGGAMDVAATELAPAPPPRRLVHADLYRCGGPEEVRELALDEALDEGAVVLVEWPERAADALPETGLHVHLARGAEAGRRALRIAALDALGVAILAAWREDGARARDGDGREGGDDGEAPT